jgi:hypothetical protein
MMPRTPFALQTGRSVEPRRRVALVWASSVTATDIIGVPALVARSTVKKPLVGGKKALHVCPKIPNLAPHLGRSTHW